jgi:hypothetical protein
MNKMSKDKRDKMLLVCIGAAGIIAIVYFFVISDMRVEIATLQSKITTLDDKRDKSDRLLKRQADFQASIEQLRKTLNARQADMPRPGQDHSWFIHLMEDRRTKFNLDVVDIRNPEPWDPGILPKFPFRAVSFHVTLLGAYTDFGKFLADFENSYPYMRVQIMNIAPEVQNTAVRTPEGAAPAADDGKLRFNFRVISLVKSQT